MGIRGLDGIPSWHDEYSRVESRERRAEGRGSRAEDVGCRRDMIEREVGLESPCIPYQL